MSLFPPRSRRAWNYYFPGSNAKEYNTRQTPSALSDDCVYILNSLFSCIKSASNGGALYCTSNYLLVESSTFISCNTSYRYGGAIYFYNLDGGQCVLHEVCGNDCCTTYASDYSRGLFLYTVVRKDASSKNYVNYSSISRCGDGNSDSRQTLHLENGREYCQSVNISMNKCNFRTGTVCFPYKDSSSVTCSLSYSTFADNNAFRNNCICFNIEGAVYEIKYCNIIRNTQVDLNNEGTIRSDGNVMIKDSCIFENNGTNIFHAQYTSYTITLSNCIVDKTTNNGYLTIQNTVRKYFILALNHLSTQYCHSEYDSVGTLTSILYDSRITMKVFYTCRKNHYQPIISDFFSLICVFLVTFIHPNPSCDL
jgi:hypothetical protein